MNAKQRLEIFGFNLKKQTNLTQKALNARECKNWKRLYRILHQIKKFRMEDKHDKR